MNARSKTVEAATAIATAGEIARAISRRIQARTYWPGAELRENELAVEFQVSRSKVREAMRILEGLGLVTILPGRGPAVSRLTDSETEEYLEINAVLMALVARRAARNATEAEVAAILELAETLCTAADDDISPEAFAAVSLDVRRAITHACHSERLTMMLRGTSASIVGVFMPLAVSSAAERRLVASGFLDVARAIAKRDADRAEHLARTLAQHSYEVALDPVDH